MTENKIPSNVQNHIDIFWAGMEIYAEFLSGRYSSNDLDTEIEEILIEYNGLKAAADEAKIDLRRLGINARVVMSAIDRACCIAEQNGTNPVAAALAVLDGIKNNSELFKSACAKHDKPS